jgi:hypothetical protein
MMTVLFLVATFLASRALAPVAPTAPVPLVPVGSPALVPGGTVTVLEVEHVEVPGRITSPDTHAIQVRFLAKPDNDTSARQLVGAMRVEGNGMNGSLAPLENPAEIEFPNMKEGGEFSLTYLVPDESTHLGVALPGGTVVSVAHADHPGDL